MRDVCWIVKQKCLHWYADQGSGWWGGTTAASQVSRGSCSLIRTWWWRHSRDVLWICNFYAEELFLLLPSTTTHDGTPRGDQFHKGKLFLAAITELFHFRRLTDYEWVAKGVIIIRISNWTAKEYSWLPRHHIKPSWIFCREWWWMELCPDCIRLRIPSFVAASSLVVGVRWLLRTVHEQRLRKFDFKIFKVSTIAVFSSDSAF